MHKGRVEAFSDGVMAILITIMVLELKIPHGTDWAALAPLCPVLMSYVLSFIYIGIYWNNHHHLMQAVQKVNGATLWANLHLLFWLSLVPFATSWTGENNFAAVPVAFYGLVLLMAGVAYFILVKVLLALHGRDSALAKAVGKDTKGILSVVFYAVGVALSPWNTALAYGCYVLVACIWLIPDRRIENRLPQ